jgi:hypothetical protein
MTRFHRPPSPFTPAATEPLRIRTRRSGAAPQTRARPR